MDAGVQNRVPKDDPQKQKKNTSHDDEEDGNNDGIVYDADDAVLFVNTNKISTLRVEDSESESESDSSYVAT